MAEKATSPFGMKGQSEVKNRDGCYRRMMGDRALTPSPLSPAGKSYEALIGP